MIPPMLALKQPPKMTDEEWWSHIEKNLPLYIQPKYDGIRCLIDEDGYARSRTLKLIRNKHIFNSLNQLATASHVRGQDGEILTFTFGVIDNFNSVSSKVMSEEGKTSFMFKQFDYWNRDYTFQQLENSDAIDNTEFCKTIAEIKGYESLNIEKGFEGSILRRPDSPYKSGRVTLKEFYLVALKSFVDSEATIVGIEEQMENTNPQTTNLLGLAQRSSHLSGMKGNGTLGALVCKHPDFEQTFKLGTGFTDKQREEMYINFEEKYIGKLAKFKYQANRTNKDKPISPVFLGIRDKEDM